MGDFLLHTLFLNNAARSGLNIENITFTLVHIQAFKKKRKETVKNALDNAYNFKMFNLSALSYEMPQ